MSQKQLYDKPKQLDTEVGADALAKLDRAVKAKVQKKILKVESKERQVAETKQMKVRCRSCTNHQYHIHEITITDDTQIDSRGAVRVDYGISSPVYND